MTSTLDNVVISTKGLQDRNINIIAGTTVENKCKLILSARMSRLQVIPNTNIRSKIQVEQPILDRIQRRQLKLYGQLLRMEDSRRPRTIYQWTPHSVQNNDSSND